MKETEDIQIADNIRSVAKHSAIYTLAGFLKKGIGFLMIPLYTHYLTTANYGLTEVLSLMLEVIGMIVGMRIVSAETRYYHLYQDHNEKREVYTTTLIFIAIASALAVIGLFGGAHSLARWTLGSESFAPHIRLIIICFGIQNIYLVAENDLIVRKQSLLISGLSIGLMTLGLSLNILFLTVYHLGVWAILWSMFAVKSVNLIVLPMTLRRDRIRFSREKLFQMIRYGMPLVPASLAMFAIHYSDRFFLQRYCSLAEVGIYSLGYKFGMMISVLITTPLQSAWSTHSFEIAKQPGASIVYARVFTYFSCLLTFLGLGISVFIKDAIGLLAPPSYAGAASLVPVVVLAYIFMGLSTFASLGIMLSFKTQYMSYIHVPSAILNIILNLILIKPYSIWGAAYATLITFGAMLIVTFLVSQRLYPIAYEYRRLALVCGTALLLYAASKLPIGSWIWLPLFHCAIVIALPLLLIAFRFFTKDEIETARPYFGRVASWFLRTPA